LAASAKDKQPKKSKSQVGTTSVAQLLREDARVGSDLRGARAVPLPPPSLPPPSASSSGFLKPAGVDDPRSGGGGGVAAPSPRIRKRGIENGGGDGASRKRSKRKSAE